MTFSMTTNTNGLAKMYDKLTPRERLPLLTSALSRRDELERGRLETTAPRVAYLLPDHFGLAQALALVSQRHFMELLHLAAEYFKTFALPDCTRKQEHAALDTRVLCGHIFKTKLAGWRQFCAEFRFDLEWYWRLLPGSDMVNQAATLLESANFAPKRVLAALKRKMLEAKLVPQTANTKDGLTTADHVAADLRDCLHFAADPWLPPETCR
jgi:hypothetical protein